MIQPFILNSLLSPGVRRTTSCLVVPVPGTSSCLGTRSCLVPGRAVPKTILVVPRAWSCRANEIWSYLVPGRARARSCRDLIRSCHVPTRTRKCSRSCLVVPGRAWLCPVVQTNFSYQNVLKLKSKLRVWYTKQNARIFKFAIKLAIGLWILAYV